MSRGLGKGLGALLEDHNKEEQKKISSEVQKILVSYIKPNKNQPRKKFDEEKIKELSISIKRHGLVQPIIVNKLDENQYLIVAGERRYRACIEAGMKEIPVIIKNITNKQVMEIALIENIQREDLNCVEEANAYRALIEEYKITQNELSEMIGKSRTSITNTMRLLKLPEFVQELLINQYISSGHARALLALDQEIDMINIAKDIVNRKLSVREVEKLIKDIKSVDKITKRKTSNIVSNSELRSIEERMMSYFEAQVKIVTKKKGSKIVIECADHEQLNRIIEKISI